jgi:hypothetical protein
MAMSAVRVGKCCNDLRCAVRYLLSADLVAWPAQGEVPALFLGCL